MKNKNNSFCFSFDRRTLGSKLRIRENSSMTVQKALSTVFNVKESEVSEVRNLV